MEHSFFRNTGNTTPLSPSYGAITQNICHYRGVICIKKRTEILTFVAKLSVASISLFTEK